MENISIILDYIWRLTALMAPSLLAGFFVAGVLSLMITPEMVYKHLGKSSLWQICKSSIFGVPLPLCSCSVLPVAASLRKNGAGRGSTISFLTSTPQTGVDSIFVTYTMLGPLFAVIRCVAAFVSGIICGSCVEWYVKESEVFPSALENGGYACDNRQSSLNKFAAALRYAFITLPGDIGRSMIFGLILSGVLAANLPENYFADRFIGNELVSMLVMLAAGLVVYVCSSGSVPIVISLIAAGISPGAGLVFLIVGPATNIAAITTVFKIVGSKASVVYLISLSICALVSGYLLNLFMDSSCVNGVVHGSHDHLSFINHLAAVLLLVLLLPAFVPQSWKKRLCGCA